jgi:hypothetical protein
LKYRIRHIAWLLFILGSCIEPYEFQTLKSERAIVIDASLTNLEEPHRVYLNYSYPIDTTYLDPITGASVRVEDSENNEYVFREVFNGLYESDGDFGAVKERSYRLKVSIEGTDYLSDWESMKAPVAIDSIYGRYVTIPSEEDGSFESGVQFFVDSHDPTGASTRFRYEWQEDYRVLTPYPTWYYFEESDSSVRRRDKSFDICYVNFFNNSMTLSTTEGLSESRISELPIRFSNEELIALHKRYALTVRQYSLSTNAYSYYKQLKDNNESAGTFFDKQKGAIVGNLQAVNDPNQVVLGFFEVSGVTETRRYFSQIEFKGQGFKLADYPNCDPYLDVDTVNIGDMPRYFSAEGLGKLISYPLDPPGSGNFVVVSPECADCRYLGIQNPPNWWED